MTLREKQQKYFERQENSIDDFIEKWKGMLEGIDPDEAKFQSPTHDRTHSGA